MKWMIVVFSLTSYGHQHPEVVEDGFRSKNTCNRKADQLENDRDWVLACVPQDRKTKRSCFYHRYVPTGEYCQ